MCIAGLERSTWLSESEQGACWSCLALSLRTKGLWEWLQLMLFMKFPLGKKSLLCLKRTSLDAFSVVLMQSC